MPSAVALKAADDQQDEGESDIPTSSFEEADDLLEAMEVAGLVVGRLIVKTPAPSMICCAPCTPSKAVHVRRAKRLGDLSHNLEHHLTEAQVQGAPWPQSLRLLMCSRASKGCSRSLRFCANA